MPPKRSKDKSQVKGNDRKSSPNRKSKYLDICETLKDEGEHKIYKCPFCKNYSVLNSNHNCSGMVRQHL